MFAIALRLITVLAIAYLFGLLVAWLVSLFNAADDGGDDRGGGGDASPPKPPGPNHEASQPSEKILVEVDPSYYLDEFELKK